MSKKLKILFWVCLAVAFVAVGVRQALLPHGEGGSVNMEDWGLPCENSRKESVYFMSHQHGDFAGYKVSGLTSISDDRTVHYDYDVLKNVPAEYRDFVLRAGCARNFLGDEDKPGRVSPPAEVAQAADCLAVKRLRDEKNYSRAQIAVIAEQIALDETVSKGEVEKRTANLHACYDAPK